MREMLNSLWRAWSARLWLAGLLIFGSEIVLWTNVERGALEWALILPGYLVLAALLLELAALYRARSVFEALALAGMVGLANGLLLNPASALVEVPRTLVTRAMGGHALLALALLGVFALLRRQRRSRALYGALALAAAWVGVLWGVWARWTPLELFGRGETPLTTMLLAGAAGLAALVGLASRLVDAPPPRLTRREWAICLIGLAALYIIRAATGAADSLALIAVPLLIVYCLGVLYFRQRKRGTSFMEGGARPAWGWLALAGAAFLAAGAVGYGLPRTGEIDPVALIAALFTAYGLVWLPCASLVLGAGAFIRQARSFRL